jgi:hypothetical protein
MNTAPTPEAAPPAEAPALSLIERTVAVFIRPAHAWGGLERRTQWWFPMLVVVLVGAIGVAALHQRAFLPMMLDQWDQAVADGQMSAAQVDQMESFFGGPAGLAVLQAQNLIAVPLLMLVSALLVWFGTGFVLGSGMKYRWALEVTCWSWLIAIPGQLLAFALAWSRQTFEGISVGFGLLLPEQETPSKLMTGLRIFLDRIGPLEIWWLVVLILGATALSKAPRRSVAWSLGGIYLVLMVVVAVLGALMSRGG